MIGTGGGAVFCGPLAACGTEAVWEGSGGRAVRSETSARSVGLALLLLREIRRLRERGWMGALCGGRGHGAGVLFEVACWSYMSIHSGGRRLTAGTYAMCVAWRIEMGGGCLEIFRRA